MPLRLSPLAGKTALITGAGKNIGREIALLFAECGANVIINGRQNLALIEDAAAEVESKGGKAMPILADISNIEQVESMISRANERFGGIDILVGNSAIRPRQAFHEISIEDWHNVINNNLNSAFYLTRSVLPYMREKKWGRIILISGHDGFTGASNRAHNVCCKAAIHALCKAISKEYGKAGITANTVAPGVIDTSRDECNYPNYLEKYEIIKEALPVGRIGKCKDVAEACLFLASENSGFITGQSIHVNGGDTMI